MSIKDEEPNKGEVDGGINIDVDRGEAEGIVNSGDSKDRGVEDAVTDCK